VSCQLGQGACAGGENVLSIFALLQPVLCRKCVGRQQRLSGIPRAAYRLLVAELWGVGHFRPLIAAGTLPGPSA